MARFLITSALPYINGVKHLGNLVGSMLPADTYARFQRARGHEVLFICATDEHGTPAELAAHEAGLPIDEYCAKMHSIQKEHPQSRRKIDAAAAAALAWEARGDAMAAGTTGLSAYEDPKITCRVSNHIRRHHAPECRLCPRLKPPQTCAAFVERTEEEIREMLRGKIEVA